MTQMQAPATPAAPATPTPAHTPDEVGRGAPFRMLPAEEWERLEELFRSSFPEAPFPPPPPLSHAIVAEADGEIVFAMFLRQEFHMEPICARLGYGGLFPMAVALLEQTIREEVLAPGGELYYVCTAPRTDRAMAREKSLGRTVLEDHVPVVGVVRRDS